MFFLKKVTEMKGAKLIWSSCYDSDLDTATFVNPGNPVKLLEEWKNKHIIATMI